MGAVLAAGVTLRRMLGLRALLLALLGGVLCGLIVLGLPAPGFVVPVFRGTVTALAAALVLPSVAGLLTSDRQGGYELLAGLRPVSSLTWTAGRALGCGLGAFVLALVLALTGAFVGGTRELPVELLGQAQAGQWRFALPKGSAGPFDVTVECLFTRAAHGTLDVSVQRGQALVSESVDVRPARRQLIVVPDLAPAVGDLYVRIVPSDGVVLGEHVPTLRLDDAPLGMRGLAPGRDFGERLGFALLAVFAAACAFHFETACLAGLLAVVRPPPTTTAWLVIAALLLLFSVLGTALVRRQALP